MPVFGIMIVSPTEKPYPDSFTVIDDTFFAPLISISKVDKPPVLLIESTLT